MNYTYRVSILTILACLIFLESLVQAQEPYVNVCANSGYGNIPNPSPAPDPIAPDYFLVTFGTNCSIGTGSSLVYEPITLAVTRSWAPIGVDRFYQLILDNYYNNAAFFRIVPNFVVQFGIAAKPLETSKWDTPINDDPVTKSNVAWTVSYASAGPNTRTTQLFINLKDNIQLDTQGFAPFAQVVSGSNTVLSLTNPTPYNTNGINQTDYSMKGNAWLIQHYPNVSIITCGRSFIPVPTAAMDDDAKTSSKFNGTYLAIAIVGGLIIAALCGYVAFAYSRRVSSASVPTDQTHPLMQDSEVNYQPLKN